MSTSRPQSILTAPNLRSGYTQPSRTLRRELSRRTVDSVVPACSRNCLETFIYSNFPPSACSDRDDDLKCLCTQRSTSGFTLEEGALRCLLSSCTVVSQPDFRVYTICSTVEDALPNTHSSLAVTVKTAPEFAFTSTTIPTPTLSFTYSSSTTSASWHSTSSTPFSTSSALGPGPSETLIPSSQSEMSGTSTAAPTVVVETALPSASSQPSSAPSRGQIIGLSVGGGVLGVAILALIVFFATRRRRFNQHFRDQRDGFEIGGEMSEPPIPDGPPLLPVPGNRTGAYKRPTAENLGLSPNMQIQQGSNMSPKSAHADDTHSMGAKNSPNSQTSMTWLLPKNTDYSTNESQQPAQIRHSSGTIFEEDLGDRQSQFLSQPFVFGAGSGFRTASCANQDAEHYTSHQVPSNATAWSMQQMAADRSPSEYKQHRSPNSAALHSISSPPTSSSLYSGPGNAASSPVTRQNNFHEYTQSPAIRQTSSNYSSRNQSESRGDHWNTYTHLQRASSQHSTSSVTSFESNGSSDVDVYRVPQRTTVQLSPVKETASPPLQQSDNFDRKSRGSPNLQVPEPAYQGRGRQGAVNYSRPSLSRESRQSQTSSHSSRLLAKRRGDKVANRMESGLGFTSGTPIIMPVASDAATTSCSRESSRSRSGSTSRPRQPHWERQIYQHGDSQPQAPDTPITPRSWKLTPTRAGANLVLRIN